MCQELDDRFEQQGLTTGFIRATGIASSRDRCGSRRATSDRTRRGRSSAATTPARTQQPAQRLGPGRVRHALDATAPDDMRLLGDPGRELLEQAGLPDADFPANEHDRSGVGHAAQRLAESRERRLTPDEIRGPLASAHNPSLWGTRPERATATCPRSATPIHRARSVVHFLRTVSIANGSGTSGVARCVQSPAPSVADARMKHPTNDRRGVVGWECPASQPTTGKSPALPRLRSADVGHYR